MANKKALIFRGGWEGHEPKPISELLAKLLEKHGIKTEIFDGIECLSNKDKLMEYDLIVPCITMCELPREYEKTFARQYLWV